MKPNEWRGKWWLPTNPDDKVSGTLVFKPGEPASLHTIGRFRKPVNRTPEGTIILGSTTNGEVTLFRCSDSWSSLPEALAELPSEWEYYAKFVLSGYHFERPEDIAFVKFGLSLNGIEDWSIGGRFVVVPDPPPGVTHVVQYSELPDITATVGDYTITVRDFAKPHIDFCREGRTTRDPYFRVESPRPVALETLLNGPVIGLHNFVAFGLGMPVAVKWLRVRPAAEPGRLVDVYFAADERPEQGFRRSDEMLFTYADISDDFEAVVRRWFRKLPRQGHTA